ncbi:MAG: hypothetical protein A2Y97_01855 [Nitrospirae bacterium RBG_13_39_12]|nr:MAG: hypothetical protein A2Y97_01855 [Nitrospirae bacterium RBG_13_39_12]
MKVLIVEDNPDDRNILRYNLENHGCEVIEAHDGQEGLEMASQHKPDIIISDAMMPRMDGFQFLRSIKKDDALKSIPFIFYTATYVGNKETELAISLGAEAFIIKPKEPEEFWNKLSGILEEIQAKKKKFPTAELIEEEEKFLRKYSEIVATKLEEKVKELEKEIAENKRAEESLKMSEEHYRALSEDLQRSKEAFLNMLEDIGIAYKDLQDLFMTLVSTMVSALDAKSPWTKGHSLRVAMYAEQIANEMSLKEEEIKDIRLAGILHDIGKIGTYDYLLDKPAKLTDEEFEIVKKHPAKSAEILKDIKQLKQILPLIRHHHERIDGRGYPDGIKGEDIPFGAKILHVADSFDAMTADRPYRPSPGKEYAISEFKRCKGTQFDPEIVEVFLRILDKSSG